MPRKPSRPLSPAWKYGRLLGAVGMAEQQMKVIYNSEDAPDKARKSAHQIHGMLINLKQELKAAT